MDRFEFWRRWMVGLAGLVMLFGISLAIQGLHTDRVFTWLLFDGDYPESFGPELVAYMRFVTGVLGAVMAGWAVLLAIILSGPFRRRERWSWNAVAISLALWFVVDTTLSLMAGYPENALLNTAIVAGFIPGLAATFRFLGQKGRAA